jgi:hypothetical protein
MESLTKGAVSKGTVNSIPSGSTPDSSASRARTPDAVLIAFAPGESWIAAAVAGTPFSRIPKA